MTGQEKITKIIETVEAGHIVYITTALRFYKIDKKTLVRFEKGGHVLLKAVGNNTYMASGNDFVCIDYCQITFT
jgi:hypothetical protein